MRTDPYFLPPVLGRFMSEDPKGYEAGDYNLFRYCGNDPIDKTDPMGLVAGFERYALQYEPNERHDATHDGYHVQGVPGTEEKPGGVHLEVDRNVSTVPRLASGASGATTHQTTASAVNGTPTIHEQINVTYASKAGAKTQTFTKNNEWTHSRDLIHAANNYRAVTAGWAFVNKMPPSAVTNMLQRGDFNGLALSVSQFNHRAFNNSREKWDTSNGWNAPNGEFVKPHTPIDAESGNRLKYDE